jgi:hypothetical protein
LYRLALERVRRGLREPRQRWTQRDWKGSVEPPRLAKNAALGRV